MSDSTAVVRRSVAEEVWQALRRLARLRLDWSGAQAVAQAQAAEEDPVGFVFAGALPARALLLEVNHVGFLWCGPHIGRAAAPPASRTGAPPPRAQAGVLRRVLRHGRAADGLGAVAHLPTPPRAPGALWRFDAAKAAPR